MGSAKGSSLHNALMLGFLAAVSWYCTSISITFANKFLLSEIGFHMPCFMTLVHNSAMSLIVAFVSRLPGFRVSPISSKQFYGGIVPISFLTAVDVATSGAALDRLSVSMYTMLKGTVPAFVLVFSLLFRLEAPHRTLAVSILCVVSGVALCALGGEPGQGRSHPFGFALACVACASAGLRWTLAQILLQARSLPGREGGDAGKDCEDCEEECGLLEIDGAEQERASAGPGQESGTRLSPLQDKPVEGPARRRSTEEDEDQSPISMVARVAPTTAMFMVPIVALAEGPQLYASTFSQAEWLNIIGCLAAVSMLVFLLLVTEYCLVRLASGLTLSVLGILKELVTILLAVLFWGEVLSFLNFVGFTVATIGILMYANHKRKAGSGDGGPHGAA